MIHSWLAGNVQLHIWVLNLCQLGVGRRSGFCIALAGMGARARRRFGSTATGDSVENATSCPGCIEAGRTEPYRMHGEGIRAEVADCPCKLHYLIDSS